MRAAQPPLPFLVFGSSLGLLGFAAATLLRVPVIGYVSLVLVRVLLFVVGPCVGFDDGIASHPQ